MVNGQAAEVFTGPHDPRGAAPSGRAPVQEVGPFRPRALTSLLCAPAMATLLLVAGCVGPEIDEMRDLEAAGSDFDKALAAEYRAITLFEADEMYDWLSAGHFARKGLRAAKGEAVDAEPIEAWDLPPDKAPELAGARARLLQALQAGARAKVPEFAAHAQGRFDCWVEQQSENRQPEHINACREKFYAALDQLEQAVAAEEPAAPPLGSDTPVFLTVLFFGFDSIAITAEAESTLREALAQPIDFSRFRFVVIGHTDSAGPQAYNDALSLRRSQAVRSLMVDLGVPADQITVLGRGELEPAVPTDSDTVLKANRRVEVLLVAPDSSLIGTSKPKHGPVAPIIALAPNLVTGSGQPTSAKRRDAGRGKRRRGRRRGRA
ncbi:MAG: OmpA family protein [Rhodospirillales bacterium]|nr:OmpA family protein [Rhodospirillales bacterium]